MSAMRCVLPYLSTASRCTQRSFLLTTKCCSGDQVDKWRRDTLYVDKRGKLRVFDRKKVSRKKGGSLRGKGWKYGSGFVDGIFPVLSPTAQEILRFMQTEGDADRVWISLESLSPTNSTWDDLIDVAVQLRLSKNWDQIIWMCEWILDRSAFQPDVICYNLLIDAYGQKSYFKKAEQTYSKLLEARCVPTEDTYALLVKAYCESGRIEKVEAILAEMKHHRIQSSTTIYNAYLRGLLKKRNTGKALEIYQRMKRDSCEPSTETYTMLINLYGKENKSYMAVKVFEEMKQHKCKPNICTYTALVNAFARDGLCEKAEEIFEQMQEAGHEPDVYAYNALMEAYSRAGYPNGAAEIFSLMQHMGCEPDRASYNIMVDAYGRAGLYEVAESTFHEMKQMGVQPTMKSHMILISAYTRVGDVSKCEDILNEVRESGLEPDTFLINSMLNLYGRLGQFDKMEQVFTAMQNGKNYVPRDISTYNIIINAYGRAGYLENMESLFEAIPSEGLKADTITWTSRIGAYSRKKQFKRCLEIFEEMIDSGCYPDGGTAKVLLSSCSTDDQIEQVTTVLRTLHKHAKDVFLAAAMSVTLVLLQTLQYVQSYKT